MYVCMHYLLFNYYQVAYFEDKMGELKKLRGAEIAP